MGRVRWLAGALLAALLVAGFLIHGRSGAARPSVVIVTFDTLRADFVPQMPEVRRLLADATHFAGARTVAPITLPAHVSLMTGLCPNAHGIRDNITPPLPAARGFPLLAEEFAAAGYATAAFVASDVLAPVTGVAAGFATYECPKGELTAEERLPAALAWLRARDPGRPFFLWVHFYDCHAPYLGDDAALATRELYLGEVRRVDSALARVIEAVPRDSILVVASDHGEGLGDHGESTHGPLCFGATIDALLAVRAPALPRGEVDRAPRSLVDVAPTLRGWCGLSPHPSDGTPLDRAPATGTAVVAESLYAWRMHGWGQCFAVSDGRFTLVESGATLALYDRASDPGEERALDLSADEAGERLDRALAAYRARAPAGTESGAVSGDGDVASPYGVARRPVSGCLSRRENVQLVDPRERFPYWDLLTSASQVLTLASGNKDTILLSRALGMLEGLIKEDPHTPAPHAYLAQAQKLMAEMTGARVWYRRAAASTRGAIERGYATAQMLQYAIEMSMMAQDTAEMDAARKLAHSGGIALDEATTAALRALEAELARLGG